MCVCICMLVNVRMCAEVCVGVHFCALVCAWFVCVFARIEKIASIAPAPRPLPCSSLRLSARVPRACSCLCVRIFVCADVCECVFSSACLVRYVVLCVRLVCSKQKIPPLCLDQFCSS
eukprot:GDKI01010302.1.p2 GENE.GDKI01010302.1~~GDKI01010302.1.p2  ORF type:complete len:118 (+),score=13.92 GDKI01010302.1:218-571(+)